MSKTNQPIPSTETIDATPSPSAEKALVVNHDARRFVLPIHGGAGKVVKLNPGLNFVPTEAWDDIERQARQFPDELPAFLKRDRRVETLGVQEPGIDSVPTDRAVQLVRLTLDRRILARWGDTETRPTVLTEIRAQLDQLDGTKAA